MILVLFLVNCLNFNEVKMRVVNNKTNYFCTQQLGIIINKLVLATVSLTTQVG